MEKEEISYSYNSSKKRLRILKDAKLYKEIEGNKAREYYLKLIK